WLHYMDPHAPYEPETDWGFGSSASDRYDSEIRSVDQGIGRVLDALEARGFAGRTIVVINGDHGEALGDHDSDFHGSTLYEEQVHVPLLMRLPGLGPQRVTRPVENIDIMPTVLDGLGMEHDLDLQGDSLVGLLLDGDGCKDPPPPVALSDIPPGMVSELSPASANKLAVRRGMWKLIHSRATADSELYDLAVDPGELRDVAHQYPERVRDLLGVLRVFEDETNRTGTRMRAPGTPLERLERLLADAPGPRARVNLVAQAAARDIGAIDGVLKRIFEDPSYGPTDRAALLPVAAPRLGMALVEPLRAALVQRDAWGLVRAALDGIAGMKPPERTEVVRRLRMPLIAALAAPGPIARPAASLLTHIGDPAGRAVLVRGTKSPDRRVAFAAGVALLRLGEDERAPALAVELETFSPDGMLAASALDAFSVRKSRVALPVVLELVKSPYLNHVTHEPVVRYLKSVADESSLAVFVFLLQGWDPSAAALVNEVLDNLIGEERRRCLREAAREAVSAFELSAARRSEDAVRAFLRVAELAGPQAGALFRVYAARESLRIGGVSRAHALARSVMALPLAKPWHPAAQAVLDAGDGAPRIEVVDVSPVVRRPVVTPTLPVAVRIRNIGKTTIAGGSWDRAVSVGVTWIDSGGRPLSIHSVSRTLPENGLEPNGEAVLLVSSNAPPAGMPVRARATVYWRDRPVGVAGANRSCPSWTWSRKRNDLDPTDMVFRGEELMRHWMPAPQFAEPELGPDGVVSYVATSWEPYLVSPGFADRGRPVEIVLEYESVVVGSRKKVTLQCYHAHDDGLKPLDPQMHQLGVEANARERLSATFEPRDGKGLRRIRIHPGRFPDLFRIWEIRVRTL
ncbi:MAG: sulfatase-like hydrolase/transferase, partial [Planctomycetes bacterium]|nr:sulfatase-like hydrolase/transferase [Planctomycetota bacterium]